MANIHVDLILEKRTPLKDGTFPVKLLVYSDRKSRNYISLSVSKGGGNLRKQRAAFSEDDFSIILDGNIKKPPDQLLVARNELTAQKQEAVSLIDKYVKKKIPFTFEKFKSDFLKSLEIGTKNELFCEFDIYVDYLTSKGRVGYARFFVNSMKSLKAYVTEKEYAALSFTDVNTDFLKDYQEWMKKNGRSDTTIGMYLRCLRKIFNRAIKKKCIGESCYPFNRFNTNSYDDDIDKDQKFVIPTSSGRKIALTKAEKEAIENYKPVSGSNEHKYRDYFLFSYYGNGMNILDMVRLKYKNMDKQTIQFVRAKTSGMTKGKTSKISVIRTPKINEIIDRWGNPKRTPDEYIFPILSEGLDASMEKKRKDQAVKMINRYIKIVANAAGIQKTITTYTARHTYASLMRKGGAAIELIQMNLGHTSIEMTMRYLDSIIEEEEIEFANKL